MRAEWSRYEQNDGAALQVVRPCFYCGESADTTDHVIPKALLRRLQDLGDVEVSAAFLKSNRVMEVSACHECNCGLGSKLFDTLEQRRQYVKNWLRRRYKRLLSIPDWTDSELAQMGPRLMEFILVRTVQRDHVRRRLAYRGSHLA